MLFEIKTFISALLLAFVSEICGEELLVKISQGVVRGLWSADRSHSMYLGIPYARVNPDNPFGESLPAPKLNEIFNAYNDSTMCPQTRDGGKTYVGTINCLDLNVYVPRSASVGNPLPVMVWIYGGGFSMGTAGHLDYGPEYLVRHDVILVTLNYRLGVFGFMCLDTPSVPGNAGLKDQRKALRWVNDNIAAFGGNKNSITLFGESAGAYSVELQILSPGSRDLFHRAILESGSALGETVIKASEPRKVVDLCKYLGCKASTSEEAISILKNISSKDILEAMNKIGNSNRPCIEKKFDGVENIITEFPEVIMSRGDFKKLPLLEGFNNHERLYIHWPNIDKPGYFDTLHDIVLKRLNASYNFPDDNMLRNVSNTLHEFYFSTNGINKDTFFDLIDFDSDIDFIHPAERSVRQHLNHGSSPVYQYVFAYSGKINFMKRSQNITVGGAAHADELGYLFTQSYVSRNDTSAKDKLMIDRMTTMWTNFAKFSNPTPKTTSLLPLIWKPASENRSFLWIDSELKLMRKPFHRRMAMWDLLFGAYKQHYRNFWT